MPFRFEAVVSRDLVLLEGSRGREAEEAETRRPTGLSLDKVLSGLPLFLVNTFAGLLNCGRHHFSMKQ